MNYPDFYYRSILYINNIAPFFKYYKDYFSSLDKAEAFCNFIVMNSSKYRDIDENCVGGVLNESFKLKKVISVVLKVIVHLFFRLDYKIKSKNNIRKLIKTWIELNYLTYRGRIKNNAEVMCLVLPFPLSLSRQIKYISMLKEKRVPYCYYGVSYSLKDLVVFICKRDMISLFNLEYNANKKSISDFLECKNLKEILVMDDIDPFSCIVNKNLSSNGVRVECTLHGVGTYSPYYFADLVNVFNKAQSDYYKFYKPDLTTNILHSPKKVELPLKFNKIVFYSGISVTTGELNRLVEERVLGLLASLCLKYSVDISVKKHPNFKGKFKLDVKPFDGEANNETLHISLYSTSYYTVKSGTSILIETKEIPTVALFGSGESIVSESDLENIFR